MKKLALILALAASTAVAQTKPVDPELPPVVKLGIALNVLNAITAFAIGVPVELYLVANPGAKQGVCEAMGGTYVPGYGDQCPDGVWLNLIPYVNVARTK